MMIGRSCFDSEYNGKIGGYWEMTIKRNQRFFRTVVEVEVLSEDTPWNGDLSTLAYDIREGDCKGSDPDFFGL